MPRPATRFGWLTAPCLFLLGAPSLALAQGNIFNPYGNSGYADFREFGSPKYATDAGLPGQARIASGYVGSRSNTFEEFTNSLDAGTDFGSGTGRPSTSGLPFYRAYQLDAQQARRASRTNEPSADQAYRDRIAKRNALYYQALNTADPKKRSELLREVDRLTQRDALDRSRPASTGPASKSARTGQAANRAVTAPATRTTPATRSASPSPTPAPRTGGGSAPTNPAPLPTPTTPAATPRATNPATNPASVPVPAPG